MRAAHCTQDDVLRTLEAQGTAFSAEVVSRTMDTMLASGRLRPVRNLEAFVCRGPAETYSSGQMVRTACGRGGRLAPCVYLQDATVCEAADVALRAHFADCGAGGHRGTHGLAQGELSVD